jgi:predicted transcriptional regulator
LASRRSRSFLAAEAIENYVAAESWQLTEIEAGVKDLDANRTVDHDAVRSWLNPGGRSESVYRIRGERVELITVFHGRQRWTDLL